LQNKKKLIGNKTKASSSGEISFPGTELLCEQFPFGHFSDYEVIMLFEKAGFSLGH
jgi:hypothetical protein